MLDQPAPPVSETKAGKSERDKMTARLRFTILQRGNFACRACGRSPLADNTVKLHVDHIVPIARGGKTIPDNLQVLCADCNLGKGVHQMSIEFVEEAVYHEISVNA